MNRQLNIRNTYNIEEIIVDLRNLISDEIINAYINNELIAKLEDVKLVNGTVQRGYIFQLCYLHKILKIFLVTNNSKGKTKIICEILNWIEEQAHIHTSNYGFNYFESNFLPEDLDTASMIIQVLYQDSSTTKLFVKRILNHKNEKGLISTWFVNHENYNLEFIQKSIIFKNNDFYHKDVLLNYLIAMKSIKANLDDNIYKNLFDGKLENYWYIPNLFSLYQLSQLDINEFKEIYKRNSLTNYLDKIKFSKGVNINVCNDKEIQRIVLNENNHSNFLNECYKIGIILSYNDNILQKDNISYNPEVLSLYQKVKSNSFNSNSWYWSLGKVGYKSYLMNKIIALENILNYD